MVKCWDLEQNKVVRHYHGHLSGVYCIDVHPTIDLVVTGGKKSEKPVCTEGILTGDIGRDSSARVWDMRTKREVFCLSGHKNTVWTLKCQGADPQVTCVYG